MNVALDANRYVDLCRGLDFNAASASLKICRVVSGETVPPPASFTSDHRVLLASRTMSLRLAKRFPFALFFMGQSCAATRNKSNWQQACNGAFLAAVSTNVCRHSLHHLASGNGRLQHCGIRQEVEDFVRRKRQ